MSVWRHTFTAFAAVCVMPGAGAAEPAWPAKSASDLSMFVTLQRFRIYADHCAAQTPALKPQFDKLLLDLDSRLQDLSRQVLADDAFGGLRTRPVPAAIIAAFKDSFEDMSHNVERQDAAKLCPKALQNLGTVNDETLRTDLRQALTAVRNMIGNLEATEAHPSP